MPTAKFPRGDEQRPRRGREGPCGPRTGPTLSTRSFQEGRGPPAEARGSGAWREEARALTLPPTSRGGPGEASRRGCHDAKATLRASDLGHCSPAKQGATAPKAGGSPAARRSPRDSPRLRPAPPRLWTPPAPARSRAFAPLWSEREGTGSTLSRREWGGKRRGTRPSAAHLDGGGGRVGGGGRRSSGALATGLRTRSRGGVREGKVKPPGQGEAGLEAVRFPEGVGLMARALDSKVRPGAECLARRREAFLFSF